MTARRDRELGLDRPITRRDFVYGSAVLAAGAVAGCRPGDSTASGGSATGASQTAYQFEVGDDWFGPGGVGDYRDSHGNTPGLVRDAHRIRSGEFSMNRRLMPSTAGRNTTWWWSVAGSGTLGRTPLSPLEPGWALPHSGQPPDLRR